jgi:transposase-like protein
VGRLPAQKPAPVFAIGEVPPVVRLDGIWITVMFPSGQVRRDRMGRKRRVKQARKVPILAAQGVWPVSGRILEQLDALGLTPQNGLALLVGDGSPGLWAAYQNRYWSIPLQRCVFHKLKNIAQAYRPPQGLDRQTAKQQRLHFIRRAARIWQAEDETQARQRFKSFCQRWHAHQPQAIETLSRDFEETLAFYAVQQRAADQGQNWPAHLLRTTSQLERTFREFRRRYRSAVLFHSDRGAQAVTAMLADQFS